MPEPKKGLPGQAPIWEWDWPWHSLWQRWGQQIPAVSDSFTPSRPLDFSNQLVPNKTFTSRIPAYLLPKTATTDTGLPSWAWQGDAMPKEPDLTGLSPEEAKKKWEDYQTQMVIYQENRQSWAGEQMQKWLSQDALNKLMTEGPDVRWRGQVMSAKQAEEMTRQAGEEQRTMAEQGAFTSSPDAQRQARAAEFEKWRHSLVGTLGGLENEVKRWFVQNKPNPYQGAGSIRSGDDEAGARKELKQARTEYQQGPPTPSWMSQLGFLPEVGKTLPLKTGFGRVETPSGQQMNKLSPSQAQYIGGAQDFFGGKSWLDILAEANLMQPYTPRGAGASRWSPQRQF